MPFMNPKYKVTIGLEISSFAKATDGQARL